MRIWFPKQTNEGIGIGFNNQKNLIHQRGIQVISKMISIQKTFLAACILILGLMTSTADVLHVGAAIVKITPPLGIPLAGYYHERGSDGVHDDLFARALVLEKDDITLAMVSLDLITTKRPFVEEARKIIESETGIKGEHVMISATHAHTGPILGGGRTRDEVEGEMGQLVKEYTRSLPGKIAQAVNIAAKNKVPGQTMAAVGFQDSIAFNRRFHMKDGSVGWNPGKLNPNIVKAAGPIDPEVPFVYFRTMDQTPVATYVNYSVHLDNVGGLEISADLPFSLSESLKQFLGHEAITLYVSGAAGDVNHIDVHWNQSQKGHQNAARMGMVLAGEILGHWPQLQKVEGPLNARSEFVTLPLPRISPEEVETSKKVITTTQDNTRANFMKLVQAHKVLDVDARKGQPLEVEVQVFTLGTELAWVALPGEVFVQLGLDLKLDSPFPQTMIAELANGSIGYIPNVRAYPQGNYEVVSARCAVGSGEKLIQTAVQLLKQIYTEMSP